ncbi:Endonuclease/exonuclease/phosphatase [Trema orientale]|uniref:Endonuclease/exonuclease/phosphatase n=1 Tax=Trema orientale TaxID=63057 RepID=A0A2P5F2Y0_TREOI|nr:Endonuclease/exonuclease/phosphatase [Trema orientale]
MTAKSLSGAAPIPIGSTSSILNDPISNVATQLLNGLSSNGLIFPTHVPSHPKTIQQNKAQVHETLDVLHPIDGTTNLVFSTNNDSSDGTKKSSKKWKMLARSKTTNKTRSKVADGERRQKRDTTNDFEEEKRQRTILGEISNLPGSAATAEQSHWYHIDMVIKGEDGFSWRYTGIYGDPERASRHYTWDILRRLNTHLNIPWVCGGDFNEFLHLNEKKGGLDPGNQNIEAFRKVLEECKLDDLGFSGPKLTWDNRREEEVNIQERLDRFVANEGWCAHFVNRRVFHHDFWGSDHRVLRLVLDNHQLELSNGTRQKSFTFEPFWVGDRECKEVIMVAWPILNQRETIEMFEATLAARYAELATWSK